MLTARLYSKGDGAVSTDRTRLVFDLAHEGIWFQSALSALEVAVGSRITAVKGSPGALVEARCTVDDGTGTS